ncbi:MAG: sugar ABC transporter permease, partial [Chloroflexi bacterium]|nr:sugar ABC transporter permease [Chloroflexota bacterium]
MAVATRPSVERTAATAPLPTRRRGYDAERRQAVTGYLFIAPAMVIFGVFTLLPVAMALYLSFTDYDVFTRMNWIGLANFQDVFDDELFWQALWNTLTYTVWSIP